MLIGGSGGYPGQCLSKSWDYKRQIIVTSTVTRDRVLIPPADCKSDGDCNGDGFDDSNRDS